MNQFTVHNFNKYFNALPSSDRSVDKQTEIFMEKRKRQYFKTIVLDMLFFRQAK